MNAFEVELDAYHRLLLQRGIAVIEKIPTALAVLGQVGRGEVRARFARKRMPDFVGVLLGGRSVAFEAKESAARKFDLSMVKDHQLGWLDLHARMGGISFVLARCNHAGPRYGRWFGLTLTEAAAGGRLDWATLRDVTGDWLHWVQETFP